MTTQPDSIMSAEELLEAIDHIRHGMKLKTDCDGFETQYNKMQRDRIHVIKARDETIRNAALDESAMHIKFMAIYDPMGNEATKDICQRLSMAIASLKTPQEAKS